MASGENFPINIEPAFFIFLIIFVLFFKLISKCSGAIKFTTFEILFKLLAYIAKPKFLIL